MFSLIYFFTLTSISSVFFRAEDISQAWDILLRIFTFQDIGHISSLIGFQLLYLVFLIMAEILTRTKAYPLETFENTWPRAARWIFYYVLIILIVRYAEPKEAFIYFQF